MQDKGSAKRSKITGHLLVTLPKVNQPKLRRPKPQATAAATDDGGSSGGSDGQSGARTERLEVSDAAKHGVKYDSIVDDNKKQAAAKARASAGKGQGVGATIFDRELERANDPDFVDNDDVPPLE